MTDSSGLAVLLTYGQNELVNLSFIVLVRVAVAVKRHHDHSNTYREKHLFGAVLHFRNMLTDMVLEMEQKVIHLNKQVTQTTVCYTLV